MGRNDRVPSAGLNAPETMAEAAFDEEGVVGVDRDPTDESLEAGIAAVFEAIRNGGDGESSADEADVPSDDDGVTFALLSELNRLWERAPAGPHASSGGRPA